MKTQPNLVVLLGPTAIGKTKISLELAEAFDGEIVSGDSMQVYRGMDIGTAKASIEERKRIPHHLIDIVEPTVPFSAAKFKKLAEAAIEDINSRGKLPFLVGGTGLYIESLCYRYNHGAVKANESFRQEMEQFVRKCGAVELHNKLREVDPETAERLHPNDTRRIIRALEIYTFSGETMSEQLQNAKKQSTYRLCLIGLTMERNQLYERIEARVDQMIEQGLVDEVQRLLENGVTAEMTSMQALGYKEIVGYLQDRYSLPEAIDLLKRNTRRFAKRQLSWFRHMDDIHWFDFSDLTKTSVQYDAINDIIAGKFSSNREYN